MAGLKRFLATAVATAGVVAATMTFAAPGNAAPYVTAPTLSVSTTSPCESTSIKATGTDFVAGSTVTLTMENSQTFSLGSVTVGPNGGFTTTVTLPEVVGTFELTAAGPPTSTNSNTAKATLNILNCAVPTPTVPVTG
jgi:hypothetical protein